MIDVDSARRIVSESGDTISRYFKYFVKSLVPCDNDNNEKKNEEMIQQTIDEIMDFSKKIESMSSSSMSTKSTSFLTLNSYKYARYSLLQSLMRMNYDTYVKIASFLSPLTIPRDELPNVQDIPFVPKTNGVEINVNEITSSLMEASKGEAIATVTSAISDEDGDELVPDCTLPSTTFQDSLLDMILLSIFRNLVKQNSNGLAISDKPGITGLLEQGRAFMLQPNQTPEAQHMMVRDTLRGLMTPVIVGVYRLFMAGIIPQRVVRFAETKIMGKEKGEVDIQEEEEVQIGPLFYAPYLTTIVTPLFFKFLVGPSAPNARKDGRAGGLLVEKCKFLQESNCKGLCLHQCKLPAQQFFKEELGMSLTVSPNFDTQECQWSFGEVPKIPSEDESFPKGCLVGCESRKAMEGALYDSGFG